MNHEGEFSLVPEKKKKNNKPAPITNTFFKKISGQGSFQPFKETEMHVTNSSRLLCPVLVLTPYGIPIITVSGLSLEILLALNF